jgi:hypothetical protein
MPHTGLHKITKFPLDGKSPVEARDFFFFFFCVVDVPALPVPVLLESTDRGRPCACPFTISGDSTADSLFTCALLGGVGGGCLIVFVLSCTRPQQVMFMTPSRLPCPSRVGIKNEFTDLGVRNTKHVHGNQQSSIKATHVCSHMFTYVQERSDRMFPFVEQGGLVRNFTFLSLESSLKVFCGGGNSSLW